MKHIGRIIARNNIIGLYIPFNSSKNLDGIYDIVEIMGELTIREVGKSFMQDQKPGFFYNSNLEDILNHRPSTAMTTKELKDCRQI